jgi:hypothetical protein
MEMPGYTYIQAAFLDLAADDGAAFARGKMVNIGLSILILGLLFPFFRRTLPRVEAAVAWLVTAFTLFVFRAGYVQAELMFYGVSFAGFVMLCRFWERPSFPRGVLAGGVEAAAYLTKGSVPPGLGAFGALFAAEQAKVLRRAPAVERPWKKTLLALGALATIPVTFFAAAYPYLRYNKDHFGSWFANLANTYAIWMDTWDMDAWNKGRPPETRLENWRQWHLLPPDVQPTHSLSGYLATHSAPQVLLRETRGVAEVLGNLFLGYGYLEYVAIYFAFLLLARKQRSVRVGFFDWHGEVILASAFGVLYLLLFGFYAPITAGNRLVLMLFLPTFWTMLRHGARTAPTATVFGLVVDWRSFNLFAFALVVLHVVFIVPMTITRIYGGG